MMNRQFKLFTAIIIVLSLTIIAACGGGGDLRLGSDPERSAQHRPLDASDRQWADDDAADDDDDLLLDL